MPQVNAYWKNWILESKTDYFASKEAEVKSYFQKRVQVKDCPQKVIDVIYKHGEDKWETAFDSSWHVVYQWTRGWSEEKRLFLEEVNRIALETAKERIAEGLKTDRGILMQIKQNLTRGAIVKKSNSLNELPGNLINMREVESLMKVVKVELGEATDITKEINDTGELWESIKAGKYDE